jgi:hypothetical protein
VRIASVHQQQQDDEEKEDEKEKDGEEDDDGIRVEDLCESPASEDEDHTTGDGIPPPLPSGRRKRGTEEQQQEGPTDPKRMACARSSERN